MVHAYSGPQVAKKTGLQADTIRQLEELKLLAPGCPGSNKKRYRPADIQRLHFIKFATDQGLSLAAIRELFLIANSSD